MEITDEAGRRLSDDQLRGWFAHHPPSNQTIVDAHEQIRAQYGDLAVSMNRLLPEGSDKQIALYAIREAMYHANACIAVAQTTGEPSEDSEPTDIESHGSDVAEAQLCDVHTWFELTYANYLVLPRSLMQSMPPEWQHKFVRLLEALRSAYRHLSWPEYRVQAGHWHYINELSEKQLRMAGVTWSDEHDPDGQPENYWDADGNELNIHNACVFLPSEDPIPHYARGRTRVPRSDETDNVDTPEQKTSLTV